MANPEHLKILKQGTDAWNKWREENPRIKANFEYADLSGLIFHDRNLKNVKFNNANLQKATFIRVNLKGANFHNANLQES
jgi:uncharacterized protein YjbI with pentapeptide repeats